MELNESKFMPFGSPTDSEKPQFKGSWVLYGHDKPKESQDGYDTFSDRYKPKSINNIINNKNNIKILQSWIKDKFEYKKSGYDYALVVGESGSGKSEFIRMCFQDLNYSLIEYDQSINNAEMEVIKNSIIISSIEMLLNGGKRKGVLIDNFNDNLSLSQVTDILKFLKTEKSTSPTIFVTSGESKLTDLLKGNVLYIDFTSPTDKDLFKFGKKICVKEQINITDSALKKIIVNSGSELRGFLSTLGVLKGKNEINDDNIDDIQTTIQRDINLDIQSTILMFVDPDKTKEEKFDFNNRLRFVSMHTSSVIQENYLSLVKKDTSLEDLSKIADSISCGDIMKSFMLTNQAWELSGITGIIGTEIPSYYIRKNYKVVKKFKIPNRFESKKEIGFIKMDIQDMYYSLSRVLFPLKQDSKWIKNMKKSSEIFRNYMQQHHIDKDKAIKIIGASYAFQNHEPTVIRKIKTKFRNEWNLLEN